MVPVVILCGQAGSGKDTAALWLVENHGAVAIGQADVLKHMARDFFGFSDEHLFGPSDKRNEVVPMEDLAGYDIEALARMWCRRVFPTQFDEALRGLQRWYSKTVEHGDKQDGLSARYVLQTLGTEWGRALNKQVWTEYAFNLAIKLLGGGWSYDRKKGLQKLAPDDYTAPDMAVITDGRFRNEALMARLVGGHAVKLTRKTDLAAKAEAAGVAGHASEAEVETIPNHFFDSVVENHTTKEDLYRLMNRVVFRVKSPPTRIVVPATSHDLQKSSAVVVSRP